MPHYKDQLGKLHFLESEEFEHLLPGSCTRISDEDAASLSSFDLAAEVRDKRAPLLAAADIEVNKREDIGEDASGWRKYRQALRDLPRQGGFPENVEWPTTPN